MFPLRAGVIGLIHNLQHGLQSVSPVWGLSACPQSGVSSPLVFPRLTGVIWGMWLSTERTESSFPCAGLSVPQFLTDYLKNVFPLRGVMERRKHGTTATRGISPACGGYRSAASCVCRSKSCFPCVGVIGVFEGAILPGPCVFPLCAGVIGYATSLHRSSLSVSPVCGLSVPVWLRDYFHLVFSLLRGVNDVVGEGICHL